MPRIQFPFPLSFPLPLSFPFLIQWKWQWLAIVVFFDRFACSHGAHGDQQIQIQKLRQQQQPQQLESTLPTPLHLKELNEPPLWDHSINDLSIPSIQPKIYTPEIIGTPQEIVTLERTNQSTIQRMVKVNQFPLPTSARMMAISDGISFHPTSSVQPTQSTRPSISPTMSRVPTRSITPSIAPTVVLSGVPTVTAVPSISQSPTQSPTHSPRPTVSATPTQVPSTGRPTVTEYPTQHPTITPSLVPTSVPSVAPSKTYSPTTTISPTTVPSGTPTGAPSETTAPSPSPSTVPTMSPTFSVQPTTVPSLSLRPSVSKVPSHSPSRFPSISPSMYPSSVPSTSQPSWNPTEFPTQQPSIHPTNFPSTIPSQTPTVTMFTIAMADIALWLDGLPTLTNETDITVWENLTSEQVKTYWNLYFEKRVIVTTVSTDLTSQLPLELNAAKRTLKGSTSGHFRTGFVYTQVIHYGIYSGDLPDTETLFFNPFRTDGQRYVNSLEILQAYNPEYPISIQSIQNLTIATMVPSSAPTNTPIQTNGDGLTTGLLVVIVACVIILVMGIAGGAAFLFSLPPRGDDRYHPDNSEGYFSKKDDYMKSPHEGERVPIPNRTQLSSFQDNPDAIPISYRKQPSTLQDNEPPISYRRQTPSSQEIERPSLYQRQTPSSQEIERPSLYQRQTSSSQEIERPSLYQRQTSSSQEIERPSLYQRQTSSSQEIERPSLYQRQTSCPKENQPQMSYRRQESSSSENEPVIPISYRKQVSYQSTAHDDLSERHDSPAVFISVAASSFLRGANDTSTSSGDVPSASNLVRTFSRDRESDELISGEGMLVQIDERLSWQQTEKERRSDERRFSVDIDIDEQRLRTQVSTLTDSNPSPQPQIFPTTFGGTDYHRTNSRTSDLSASVQNSRTSSAVAGTPDMPDDDLPVSPEHQLYVEEEDHTPHLMNHTHEADEPTYTPSLTGFSMQILDIDDLEGDL